ncbi:hypothetical protein BC828DRAFT_389409 [Blastocladiella britannica]|nr:hypothetical protein BC828DRAFT_389409 [Blastocladiella britannica]
MQALPSPAPSHASPASPPSPAPPMTSEQPARGLVLPILTASPTLATSADLIVAAVATVAATSSPPPPRKSSVSQSLTTTAAGGGASAVPLMDPVTLGLVSTAPAAAAAAGSPSGTPVVRRTRSRRGTSAGNAATGGELSSSTSSTAPTGSTGTGTGLPHVLTSPALTASRPAPGSPYGRSSSALPAGSSSHASISFGGVAVAAAASPSSASAPGGSIMAPAAALHMVPARTHSVVRRHTLAGTDPGASPGPNGGASGVASPQALGNSVSGSASAPAPLGPSGFSMGASMTTSPLSASPSSPTAAASAAAANAAADGVARRRTLSRNFGANKIDKNHEKYAFMYHMLTGIRLSVSRCETKEDRELLPDDFKAMHKLTSDVTGSELEPSQRYDFKFKDYCPMVFRKIRAAFGLTAPDYLNSLTGKYILSELFSPGKSKSYLYYSHDYRYIIKTIHPAEQKRLLKILPQYVDYVAKNPNTLLARYYGLHRVKMPKKDPVHFVVMANVFPPNYDIHMTFDLKGSTIGREISAEEMEKKGKRAVLKDQNWLKLGRQLMLGPEKARQFADQLERDMLFLMAKNIMDYSLLIGVHDLTKGNEGTAAGAAGGMAVFEPNRATLQRRESQHPSGRADTVRRALAQPEITRLDAISSLHLDPVAPPRGGGARSIFTADNGGMRATDHLNRPLQELYFMSVIDILTPYDATKKAEHAFKALVRPSERHAISAVKPQEYGRRFVAFMKGLIGTPPPPPPPLMALTAPIPAALAVPGGGGIAGSSTSGLSVTTARPEPIGEESEEVAGSQRSLNQ